MEGAKKFENLYTISLQELKDLSEEDRVRWMHDAFCDLNERLSAQLENARAPQEPPDLRGIEIIRDITLIVLSIAGAIATITVAINT